MKKYFFIFIFWNVFAFADKEKTLVIEGENHSRISLHSSEELKGDGADRFEKNGKLHLKLKADSVNVYLPQFKNVNLVVKKVQKIEIHGFEEININLSAQNSNVSIQKSNGSFKISLDEGQLNISQSQGSVEFKSYLASVNVSEFKGQMKGISFSGSVLIQKSNGEFDIETFSESLSVERSSGQLNFSSQKSNVRLRQYVGSIKGYTKSGSVKGSLSPTQAEIETGSGEIHLYFSNSRARVEAQSWRGRVLAPAHFYKDRAGGVYKAFGSIKDRGDRRGNVYLKSYSGKISVL